MGSCHSSSVGRRRGGDDCTAPAAAVTEVPAASTTASFSSSSSSSSLYPTTSRQRWWKKKSSKTHGVGVCSEKIHEFEVPGRICTNGSSRIACLYTQQGKKGVNQDAMIVQEVSSHCYITLFFVLEIDQCHFMFEHPYITWKWLFEV